MDLLNPHADSLTSRHPKRPMWPTGSEHEMPHDATDQIARLAYREDHARWTGDMVGADEAHAALEAAVIRFPNEDWPAVHAAYRAALVDNRHE